MSRKLYVGGLPYSVTEEQLEQLFSEHGNVESAKVITDRDTGRSRGFGFVEMESQEKAQKAISSLNGTELDGRTLTVNEAKPGRIDPVVSAVVVVSAAAEVATDGSPVGCTALIKRGAYRSVGPFADPEKQCLLQWGKVDRL